MAGIFGNYAGQFLNFSGIFDSISASKQMLHVIETWLSTINIQHESLKIKSYPKALMGGNVLVFRIPVEIEKISK